MLLAFLFMCLLQKAEEISGTIGYKYLQNSNKVYTLTGAAQGTLISTQPIFYDGGNGVCEIDGKGYTITIITNVVPGPSESLYFIGLLTNSDFKVRNCTFAATGNYIKVIGAQGSKKVSITSCQVTNTNVYVFGEFRNTVDVTVENCLFTNMIANSYINTQPQGFILSASNCSFTLKNSNFTNISSGAFESPTVHSGFLSPVGVLVTDSLSGTTISGCVFINCTGHLAGAITIGEGASTGPEQFTSLVFSGNSYTVNSTEGLNALFALYGIEVAGLLGESTVLGHDFTRGGLGLPVTSTCSNSTTPHYRNGAASTGENFDGCTETPPGNEEDEEEEEEKDDAAARIMPHVVWTLILSIFLATLLN